MTGQPSPPLRQRLIKATRGGRDAHGGVPFDQKPAWQRGYDEARRQILDAAERIEAEDASAPPMVCDRCGATSNENQCPKGMHHQFVWVKPPAGAPASTELGASGATSNESPGSVEGAS